MSKKTQLVGDFAFLTGTNSVIEKINNAADFYHSMFLEPSDTWRQTQWLTALDILDRVRGQEEGTSLKNHLLDCDTCNGAEDTLLVQQSSPVSTCAKCLDDYDTDELDGNMICPDCQ